MNASIILVIIFIIFKKCVPLLNKSNNIPHLFRRLRGWFHVKWATDKIDIIEENIEQICCHAKYD